jgi:asparagine N-glycosylation enzyme membrane subunit Stt3
MSDATPTVTERAPRRAGPLRRMLGLAGPALLGLLAGAIAGLFLASWAGWVPQFGC